MRHATFGWEETATGSNSPPPRGRYQNDADDRENRTADDPWALVDHEAGGGPVDEAGALPDPQQSHQQCGTADDQQDRLHGWAPALVPVDAYPV